MAKFFYFSVLFSLIQIHARPLYVSADYGNDNNDGSKPTNAFKTLQAAADKTRPGDTVWVDYGIYQSKAKEILRIKNSGTDKKWIVYKSISEDRPIIKIQFDAAILIDGASYISIEGFEIKQDDEWYDKMFLGADPDFKTSTGNGITSQRVSHKSKICHHIKIQDNLIHSCPGSGIFFQHADYLTIQFNQIYENGELNLTNNSGIRIQHLVEFDQNEGVHILINGNTIHHQRRKSRLEEEIADCDKTYSGSGISVRDNRYATIDASSKGYLQPIQISNNVIHNNSGIGIDVIETDHLKIIHNTCFRNNRNIFVKCGELYIRNSTNGVVANNIFYANQDKRASQINNFERFFISHNLYFNSLQFTRGEVDLVTDPMFVKANNFESLVDFQLKSKSPAIDAGNKLYTTAYDHAGSVRIHGSQVDIGAYEYIGSKPHPRNYKPAHVDDKTIKLFWQAGYSETTDQILISNHKNRNFSARLFRGNGVFIQQVIEDENSYGGIEFDVSDFPEGWYFVVAYNQIDYFVQRFYVK
ncbi:MAG: right-handed parallel beta-helix repeat-containing protein [Saprospiraceae bacterium]|nr:right-handed parallel beta-helix repeat-containing protein [Saprospiraceae bacterium]